MKMKRMAKTFLLLVIFFALYFFLDDSMYKSKKRVVGKECAHNSDLLVSIGSDLYGKSFDCFSSNLERIYLYENQGAALVFLRNIVAEDSLFSEASSWRYKIEILNILIPRALRGEIVFDSKKERPFVEMVIARGVRAEKGRAILVLGYFRNDSDIPLFESYFINEAYEIKVPALISLVSNCSALAKQSIVKISVLLKEESDFSEEERKSLYSIIGTCLNVDG